MASENPEIGKVPFYFCGETNQNIPSESAIKEHIKKIENRIHKILECKDHPIYRTVCQSGLKIFDEYADIIFALDEMYGCWCSDMEQRNIPDCGETSDEGACYLTKGSAGKIYAYKDYEKGGGRGGGSAEITHVAKQFDGRKRTLKPQKIMEFNKLIIEMDEIDLTELTLGQEKYLFKKVYNIHKTKKAHKHTCHTLYCLLPNFNCELMMYLIIQKVLKDEGDKFINNINNLGHYFRCREGNSGWGVQDVIDGDLTVFLKGCSEEGGVTTYTDKKGIKVMDPSFLNKYLDEIVTLFSFLKQKYQFLHGDFKTKNAFFKYKEGAEGGLLTFKLGDLDKSSITFNGVRFCNKGGIKTGEGINMDRCYEIRKHYLNEIFNYKKGGGGINYKDVMDHSGLLFGMKCFYFTSTTGYFDSFDLQTFIISLLLESKVLSHDDLDKKGKEDELSFLSKDGFKIIGYNGGINEIMKYFFDKPSDEQIFILLKVIYEYRIKGKSGTNLRSISVPNKILIEVSGLLKEKGYPLFREDIYYSVENEFNIPENDFQEMGKRMDKKLKLNEEGKLLVLKRDGGCSRKVVSSGGNITRGGNVSKRTHKKHKRTNNRKR